MTTTLFAAWYARVTGIVLILVGIVGFVSQAAGTCGYFGDSCADANAFLVYDSTHNVVHVLLGAVAAYVGFASKPVLGTVLYGRIFGAVYLALGIAGFVDAELFGIGPAIGLGLELGENVIHVALGVVGLLAGFFIVQGESVTGAKKLFAKAA